jgi:hypothetical protein
MLAAEGQAIKTFTTRRACLHRLTALAALGFPVRRATSRATRRQAA